MCVIDIFVLLWWLKIGLRRCFSILTWTLGHNVRLCRSHISPAIPKTHTVYSYLLIVWYLFNTCFVLYFYSNFPSFFLSSCYWVKQGTSYSPFTIIKRHTVTHTYKGAVMFHKTHIIKGWKLYFHIYFHQGPNCNILRFTFDMLSGAKSQNPCRFLFSHLINQQWVAPAIASLHYSVFVLWQKAVALIRRDDLFSIMRIDGFSSAPPNIFSLSLTLPTAALILSYPPHRYTSAVCREKE